MERPSAYEFRPERGWRWLQRLCLWVLAKLRCDYLEKYVTHVEYVLELDTLAEMVYKQAGAVEALLEAPRYILLGRKQMKQFIIETNQEQVKYEWQFGWATIQIPDWYSAPVGSPYYPEAGRIARSFAGLIIVVIPWMDGVLVVPELREWMSLG